MNQKGQALISILLVMAMAVLVFSSALVSTSLSKTAGISTESDKILYSAETGVEEALIKLLRDPNYTGETINNLGGVSVTVSVTPTLNPNEMLIRSGASSNDIIRTVEVLVEFTDNILTITNWKQVP
jgi:hypothetical protein